MAFLNETEYDKVEQNNYKFLLSNEDVKDHYRSINYSIISDQNNFNDMMV